MTQSQALSHTQQTHAERIQQFHMFTDFTSVWKRVHHPLPKSADRKLFAVMSLMATTV